MIVTFPASEEPIRMTADNSGMQLIVDCETINIQESEYGVRFITDDGEELLVQMRGEGFEFVYVSPADPDVEQWYQLYDGFVRRLSVKKGASKGNGGNVVPFPKK